MKKLTYIVQADIVKNQQNGVTKKIFNQYRIFSMYFDTYIIAYDGNEICVYHGGSIKIISGKQSKKHRRYKLFEFAYLFMKEQRDEFCYIRYGYSDYSFLNMVKKLKAICNDKVIIEIPTYPYDIELDGSLKYKLLKILDKITSKKLYNYIDRIATFSNDKMIFGIKCLNIINGVFVEDIPIRENNIVDNTINLLAVSSMVYWHGYDRMIEGLHQYYEDGYNRKIIFHLIGDGPELPKYKKLVEYYHLKNNVIFNGFKSGKDIDRIYNKCNLAVDCLGAHRKNLYLSSSLKSREYGSKGMPIITSCKIDMFPENYKYIFNVPADEMPVDIKKIIEFYDKIYYKRDEYENINNEIREFTKCNADMQVVMSTVINFFINN